MKEQDTIFLVGLVVMTFVGLFIGFGIAKDKYESSEPCPPRHICTYTDKYIHIEKLDPIILDFDRESYDHPEFIHRGNVF